MTALDTVPYVAQKTEAGFVSKFVNYIGFLAATYSVARSWSAHQQADRRALERAGMTKLQDQVLALKY